MKKVISTLLIAVMCCGLFAGCGEKETVTNDFDSKTNQKCSIRGYSFEVPEKWEKTEDTTEEMQMYLPEEGLLQVSYLEITDIMNENTRKEFFDGLANDFKDYEALSGSEIQVSGKDAYQQKMNVSIAGKAYTSTMILFECNGGTISFFMHMLQDSKKDYSEDFEKIIQSIVVPVVKDLNYIFINENVSWNMELEEVKNIEKRELDSLRSFEKENPAYLSYKSSAKTDKYGGFVENIYCFKENQLKAYWSDFDESKISDYKGMYDEIKNKVSEKYGECESEEINWTDTTYQDDVEKWNDAFKSGYVTIKTTWHTGDSVILIKWDYNKGLLVITTSPDFESQL